MGRYDSTRNTADHRPIEFCGEVKQETEFAVLVFDGAHETWIPKSQVKSMRQIGSRGDDYEFEIPEWLARSKGII